MSGYVLKYKDDDNTKWTKITKELLNAIKPTKFARFYYPIFCIRRILFVVILLSYEDLDSKVKLILFNIVQFAHVIYIIACRPFIRFKDNLGEIVNEGFYLLFTGFLAVKIGSKSWSSMQTDLYMYAIITNAVVFVIISIGKYPFL